MSKPLLRTEFGGAFNRITNRGNDQKTYRRKDLIILFVVDVSIAKAFNVARAFP